MEAVRVTLIGPRGATAHLGLHAQKPVSELMHEILAAIDLSRDTPAYLRSQTTRYIPPDQSLAGAGVSDGQRLLLQLSGTRSGDSTAYEEPPQVILSTYRVLPCYLTVDVSSSMRGLAINEVNREVPRLIRRMQQEFQLAETAQFSIVTFDRTATTRLPLTDVGRVDSPPSFLADVPVTNYAAAFVHLRETIAQDLYDLQLAGRRPYRPAVFFLSDGQPNEGEWEPELAELTNRDSFFGAPNIVSFGFGDARDATIRAVGQRAAYMPNEGAPSANLAEFMTFILSSLNRSVDSQQPEDADDILEVPMEAPPGWRPLRRR